MARSNLYFELFCRAISSFNHLHVSNSVFAQAKEEIQYNTETFNNHKSFQDYKDKLKKRLSEARREFEAATPSYEDFHAELEARFQAVLQGKLNTSADPDNAPEEYAYIKNTVLGYFQMMEIFISTLNWNFEVTSGCAVIPTDGLVTRNVLKTLTFAIERYLHEIRADEQIDNDTKGILRRITKKNIAQVLAQSFTNHLLKTFSVTTVSERKSSDPLEENDLAAVSNFLDKLSSIIDIELQKGKTDVTYEYFPPLKR